MDGADCSDRPWLPAPLPRCCSASLASGSLVSILLFYLAPLPILIAALGWSHWSALVASLTAALGLAVVFGSPFHFLAFLIGVGLPAWWLGYLALLARPAPANPGQTEWYPAGRLVIWAALVSALVVIIAIPNLGTDEESLRAGLRTAFERMLRAQKRIPADAPLVIEGVDAKRLVNFFAEIIPYAAVVIATLTNCINLWLAGRVVKVSGNLRRPWPDLTELRFPPYAPAALAAAIAGSFLPDLIGTAVGHRRRRPADGLRVSRLRGPACDHARRPVRAFSSSAASMSPSSFSAGRSW